MDKKLKTKGRVNDKKDFVDVYWSMKLSKSQILSSEKADELLKAAVLFCKQHSEIYTDNDIWRKDDPNVEISTLNKGIWMICSICKFESNSVEERIEHLKSERHEAGLKSYLQSKNKDENICLLCGFYSESVQERIEHLKGSRHEGAEEVKKAIIYRILENYTTNTFYCTVCSWFVTDIHHLIEHISSSRHNNALFLCQYKNKGIIKTDFKGKVYCPDCKCILKSESDGNEIYDHLMNHRDKCTLFNFHKGGCFLAYCGWLHKCGICRGEHPQIKCLYRGENSSVDPVHGNERIIPESLKTPMEGHAIVSWVTGNSDTNMCRENSDDSSLHCTYSETETENEYVSKGLSRTKSYYKHYVSEYNSKSSKEISNNDFKNVNDGILYSPENDENKIESRQTKDRSRSPPRRYRSRSPYDSSISNLKSPIESDPVKEHSSNSPLKQPPFTGSKQRILSISSISVSDVDSDDEDEEFNIITIIEKLLRLCDLLGNLGYFFAVTLNTALEIKEPMGDVLDILREPANIILMEVLLKKLKTFEISVSDMRASKIFRKGITYLTYLIDVSKSPQQCNSYQNSSFMLDSSPLPSVRSSTNKDIVSHSSSASAEALASKWPSYHPRI